MMLTEHSSCRRARRAGFTLMELLVVVAVIALLISILLPSLSRAREQGKSTVCLSNMRNLMLATQMYEQSYDGHFPSAGYYHGGQANEADKSWIIQLANEYGKQRDMLRCPSDLSPFWSQPNPDAVGLNGNPDDPNDPGSGFRQTSYASNGYTAYPVGDNEIIYNRRERIRWPSTTIFWAEIVGEGEYANADHVHPETWWSNPRQFAGEQIDLERHLKKANYAFVDGHAESLPFEQTYAVDTSTFPPTFIVNKYDPKIGH